MEMTFPAAGVVRHADLVAAGFTPDEIERLRRTGRLRPVRRGSYRDGTARRSVEKEHALAARAALPDLAPGAVFGHATAAVLLGLPLYDVPLRRLHVVRARGNGGRIRAGLHVHPAVLPGDDVQVIDGLPVTSAARTVADLTRTLTPDRALVVADAALHRHLLAERTRIADPGAATADAVRAVLARQVRCLGRPGARRVLGFADGLAESPGESLSRLACRAASLPPPVLQWAVPGTDLRCDFAWPDRGVVGEFDGRAKYERSLRPGESPADAVWQEKRREDRIRATGLTVVRWVWVEIGDPGPQGMVQSICRALGI